jgi:hypothetical protein
VEDALRSVGQTFACLGTADPRLNTHGDIDFRLQRQLRAYSRLDPPPHRVKPIPLRLIHAATHVSLHSSSSYALVSTQVSLVPPVPSACPTSKSSWASADLTSLTPSSANSTQPPTFRTLFQTRKMEFAVKFCSTAVAAPTSFAQFRLQYDASCTSANTRHPLLHRLRPTTCSHVVTLSLQRTSRRCSAPHVSSQDL